MVVKIVSSHFKSKPRMYNWTGWSEDIGAIIFSNDPEKLFLNGAITPIFCYKI